MAFEGQIVELPLGQDGLTGSNNIAAISPAAFIDATNIAYDSGAIRKEGGATKYNTSVISGAPTVLGGWDWFPTAGVQRMVVYTSAGTLLKDSGAGTFATTLKSGLNTTCVPVFVEGGQEAGTNARKLFTFNGANVVQVLNADGATTSDITTPPADWTGSTQPISGCIHEGRLWGALNNRVYYSLPTNHEDFTTAGSGSLAVFPGEGERIVQIMSYKGILIIWKSPRGIYAIDTTSVTVADWRVARITLNIGSQGPLTAVATEDDVLFVDSGFNFQFLSGIQEFGQLGSKNLSNIHYFTEYLRAVANFGRMDKVRGVYYAARREAHFTVSALGSAVNSARVVVDFNRPDIPRFRWSPRDVCESIWMRRDTSGIPRPLIGDNAGFVWFLDQPARSKDGLGFLGQFQTPHTDFSFADPTLAVRRKSGRFLELVANQTGNWATHVDIIWDGTSVQTVDFNMGTSGVALGTFIIGTDKLGGAIAAAIRHRIVGSGRRLSLRFYNNGVSEDFSISKAFVGFQPSDERP
mgnify:CR=1 FL=1